MRENKNKPFMSYIPFLLFLLIPVLFYAKYYMQGLALGDADLVQYFSTKRDWSQMLLHGQIRTWNPYLAGGMPQIAISDGYIISTLLAFLPLKEYIYVYYILHLFVGTLFFYLYLKECDCNVLPAYCMAIIYECSIQINGYRKGHPTIVAAICLFPLVMYLIRKFLSTRKSKWLWLSALASGLQFTIGIQYGIYAMMIMVCYLIFSGFDRKFNVLTIVKYGIIWVVVFVGCIAYEIVPTLGMMSEYASMGASETSFETFRTFSLHPVKYLLMVYPKLFGGNPLPMGIMNSSENDLELYLGILILILAVFAIVTLKKRNEVRIELFCLLFAMIYSCVAHIPVLNKIVFHIPVIGGFRGTARMLFIVYFFIFTLAARGLDSLYERNINENKHATFGKILKNAFIVNCIAAFCVIISAFVVMAEDEASEIANQISDIFVVPTLVLFFVNVLFLLFNNGFLGKFDKEQIISRQLFCVVITIITILEVLPYSCLITPSNLSDFEMDNELKLLFQQSEYKVWDAFGNIDGAHISPISQNRNVVNKVATINSYTAYNNPMLAKYIKNFGENNTIPFNFSGLQTGSLNVKNNILYQNDFWSMMGVKYLIDTDGIITENDGKAYVFDDVLTTTELEEIPVSLETVYQLVYDKDGVRVYENTRANSLIYHPAKVIQTDDIEKLYEVYGIYNLNTVAYLKDFSLDINNSATKIESITLGNNAAEAVVTAEQDTYVCFSQCYSKNWKVYVDGQKHDVDLVNGIIMGIKVPSGTHKVEFKYFDMNYVFGLVISIFVIIGVIINFMRNEEDKKK